MHDAGQSESALSLCALFATYVLVEFHFLMSHSASGTKGHVVVKRLGKKHGDGIDPVNELTKKEQGICRSMADCAGAD